MNLVGEIAKTSLNGPRATPVWLIACDNRIYNEQELIEQMWSPGINYYVVARSVYGSAKHEQAIDS